MRADRQTNKQTNKHIQQTHTLHHAYPKTAPLAARASTSDLQDRRPGLSVSHRPGTGVPGRRLSAHLRRQHTPTPINRHSDVRRPRIK